MASGDIYPRVASTDSGDRTAFLVVDTESVPDGELLAKVKYPDDRMTPEEAVERAQKERLEKSNNESDFIPVTFHVPVAVSVVRVGAEFDLQAITCLDAPQFRTREITKKFWLGVAHYCDPSRADRRAKLVTFNGRGFDMPLMELSAYRHGVSIRDYLLTRDRFRGPLDLQDFLTNFGACRLPGGLNLLAKMLGLPGKMDVRGNQVYEMHREGKLQEINDYCLCDTLDTYFVFLRTRVMTGELALEQETETAAKARSLLVSKCDEFPVLSRYLECRKKLVLA